MTVRVNHESFKAEVLESDRLVLVDFYSDSCIPCKQLAPILADLADENSDTIKIVKINTNYESQLVDDYKVMAAPTIVFFKAGSEIERVRGLASQDELQEKIRKLLAVE